jgi:hypothetical protein
LAKIQNGHQLAAVITALGGKDMADAIADKLFTETVLAKIQSGVQLVFAIEVLGHKDMKPAIAVLLLIETVLAKIQNGYELARVIRALGGKHITPEIAALLLIETVLAKIENSAQLAEVIGTLGGREINPKLRDLLIKKILLPKAEALVSKMGFRATRTLKKFIIECNTNLAGHADSTTWAAFFVASATQAELYGPKAVGEGHQRHSLALLTASLVRHSGMDQSPSFE